VLRQLVEREPAGLRRQVRAVHSRRPRAQGLRRRGAAPSPAPRPEQVPPARRRGTQTPCPRRPRGHPEPRARARRRRAQHLPRVTLLPRGPGNSAFR